MKLKVICLSLAITSVPFCGRSYGQTAFSGSSISENGTRKTTLNFRPRPWAANPISGEPYSADRIQESAETLADGTRITHRSSTGRVVRDSQGRERDQWTMPMADDLGMQIVEITDPIGGYRYVLDGTNRIAHRYRVVVRPRAARVSQSRAADGLIPASHGSADRREVRTLTSAEILRPKSTEEDLGTKVIEGVLAHGSKTTTTFPAFSQGNNAPMVVMEESWIADELNVMVILKHTEARRGESTMRLTNIARAEPDPALFQPPAGYKTVDETGPFTMEILSPAAR